MTDCIEWPLYRDRLGYGKKGVKRNGRKTMIGAHRWTWEQAHGPIPDGLCVMHTCDNPSCVNLDHLRLGTRSDNTRDMITKGRSRLQFQHGEHNGQARLTEDLVREIRNSPETIDQLAARLGVHRTTVDLARRHKTWAHVQE